MLRVATLDKEHCKPDDCGIPCYRFCPEVLNRRYAIKFVEGEKKPIIVEDLCTGCGICVDPSTNIMTEHGPRTISELHAGDAVLTHTGRFRKVLRVMSRKYTGPLYEISVYGLPEKLLVTGDHPLLCGRRKASIRKGRLENTPTKPVWVNASEVKRGEYLIITIPKETSRRNSIAIDIPVAKPHGRGNIWLSRRLSFPLNSAFFRLIGYYLAEGSASGRRIVFTFASSEKEYVNDVRNLMKRFFKINPKIHDIRGSATQVRIDSALVARFFGMFGRSADSKKVPTWVLKARLSAQKALILSEWRGDGYCDPRRNYFKIMTVSPTLAYQLMLILGRLGVKAAVAKTKSTQKRTCYAINVFGDSVAKMADICNIRSIERRNRTASRFHLKNYSVYAPIRRIALRQVSEHRVMNLEIQNDQSYVASGVAVHNCIKKCPFDAITIVKLPQELDGECIHAYGVNEFKLFRLPVPRPGTVIGLIGRNGTGKSTALRILAGELTPNFGNLDLAASWDNVLSRYRGTLLFEYFSQLTAKKLKVVHKPQHVDKMGNLLEGIVGRLLRKVDERRVMPELITDLELGPLLDRDVKVLSGGEAQRVAIAAAISRSADVYMFDEPSSHLDVYQRVRAARSIRRLIDEGKSVLIAEHDLAMLDYLSDDVYLIYGQSGSYGVVSHIHPTRSGINHYLTGFLPDENMRFRDEPIRFHVRPPRQVDFAAETEVKWPPITKNVGSFELEVEAGSVNAGEIVGIVGPNGIGKTTFIKELLDHYTRSSQNKMQVSYKPQYIATDFEGTVDELLSTVADDYSSAMFMDEVIKPLAIPGMLDRPVKELSGGELQRVAIAACLGKKAQVYLLDEPSAFLDVEERLNTAKAVRHLVDARQAFAFVVEHDIVAQDFFADRIMVFKGTPSRKGIGTQPLPLRDAMNLFLADMGITFRRDPETKRPRINKFGSKLDKEQKDSGEFYYVSHSE